MLNLLIFFIILSKKVIKHYNKRKDLRYFAKVIKQTRKLFYLRFKNLRCKILLEDAKRNLIRER